MRWAESGPVRHSCYKVFYNAYPDVLSIPCAQPYEGHSCVLRIFETRAVLVLFGWSMIVMSDQNLSNQWKPPFCLL